MLSNMRKNRGISIIDCMIAFAATAIVLAYTLPSAFDDRIRDNVSVSLAHAAPAKAALRNTCVSDENAVVNRNLDAGYFYVPSGSRTDHMKRIMLGADCASDSMVIVIWTIETGARQDPILELTAEGPAIEDVWVCRIIQGDPRFVPAECRQRYRTG